jgi:cytochrome c1
MKTITRLLAAAGFALGAMTAVPALGAGGVHEAKSVDFTFEGPFGTFDRAQLQRGYQVYKEVCSSCHGLRLLSYRNLGDAGGPEFPEPQIKAFAAEVEVPSGPDAEGETHDEDGAPLVRNGLPSDRFVSPFANDNAARFANNGALPPDLSLIAKARAGYHGTLNQFLEGAGGAEYVYSILTGYEDPPAKEAENAPEGLEYNPYFPGKWIAMLAPLSDDQVEYADGTKASLSQMSEDVSAFLMWAAEPKLEERKRTGFQVLIYLIVLSVLLYFAKKKVWARVDH